MGHEGFTTRDENRKKSPEKRTIIIRTTDKVVQELMKERHLERMSQEARRVLERIFRENNGGKKTIVSGETKAIAAWIHEVRVAVTDVQ